MWIELSKFLPYLVYPLTLFLVLTAAGAVSRRLGARRLGGVLIFSGVAVLLAASNPWLAHRFRAGIEGWYPALVATDAPTADAIVILGGALDLPLPPRVDVELHSAADRIWYGARLYRAGRAPLVLVTGGNVFEQIEGVRAESHYMARLLREWGVPGDAIVTEETSRNTRQNAVESKKILEPRNIKTILLVTSAFHMPRALSTFRRVGLDAIPAPVDFLVSEAQYPLGLDLLPSANALAITTDTLREYLGILVYGVRGWLQHEAPARPESTNSS